MRCACGVFCIPEKLGSPQPLRCWVGGPACSASSRAPPAGTWGSIVAVNSSVRQELRIDETFQEPSTTFVAFQLLPEVPARPPWGPARRRHPPAPASTRMALSASAGAAVGRVRGVRRPVRLGPEGPGPAAREGAPARLCPGHLHDPGEEAGEGPPGVGVGQPFTRPRGPSCPVLTPVSGRCGWAARGCLRASPGGRST